ncbi:MAG: DUF6605 domain-containing protein [Planctomycetota bacterium]
MATVREIDNSSGLISGCILPTDHLAGERRSAYWQSLASFSSFATIGLADVLFQCSDNTWQAYNRWPNDFSIYTHPKGTQGPWADVSFDRPYGREALQHAEVVNDPLNGRFRRVSSAGVPTGVLA